MKIIKNAMTEPILIICPECKSTLEYTYQDIQRREDTVFGYYTSMKKYIICPVCKTDIYLGPKVEVKDE